MVELNVGVNDFTQVLTLAGKCIDVKPLVPIMNDVLVNKNGDEFTMTACNAEMRIEVPFKMAVTAGEFDQFCVNHAKLLSGMNTLPKDSNAKLTINEGKLIVAHDTGKFVIPIDDAKEYPISTPPEGDDIVKFRCNSSMFIKDVDMAKLCVAATSLRPILCSVCMDITESKLNMASTCGFSLFLQPDEAIDTEGATISRKIALPASALPAVNVFSDSENINIMTDSKHIYISNDAGMKFSVRMIEGEYPNYMALIPTDLENCIKVNKAALELILKRANIFTNSMSKMIILTKEGGYMGILGEDVNFLTSINEKLPILNDSKVEDGFKIGCSLVYLGAVLSAIESENVIFYFDAPNKAFILKEDKEDSKKILLLMPMNI